MDVPEEPLENPHNILSFRPATDPAGLTIVDHVERRRCTLQTPDPVDPQEVPSNEFYFPVDRGVAISTDHLALPHTVAVCVRNHAGFMVEELTEGDERDFPSDLYSVEITAPIKLYLTFEGSFSVSVLTDRVTFELSTPDPVLVGARSHHESPAGTITTTEAPEDMMAAISYFGSALKTTSSERSYPTLRGHPPTIEIGKELRVPPILETPDTGVRLILPPDHRSVYVASTLAYYLGATVESGDVPRLETDHGFAYDLTGPERGFEEEVERVLKQVFFLDCVARTEGYYPVNLHERNQIEDDVSLDFAALYEQSLASQLEAYLGVPFSTIEPHLPEWKLTAHTTLDPAHAEMLPFVVYDLAIVRSSPKRVRTPTDKTVADDTYRRSGLLRSAIRSDADSAPSPELIELDDVDSLEQTWIGEGAPLGASKAMIEAFRNRLERKPTDGDIDITVVCNDMEMEGERDIVDEVYGSREELPFDVTVLRELTSEELREVLAKEIDFFHYIGHIDAGGFECANGRLDAFELDQTGVDAFFLNACTSYQQGMNLIKAGSIGGVVTLQDVINSGAERVGKTLARLLNRGFPLQISLKLAKKQSIMGGHYLVLGDGSLDVAQPESGNAVHCEIKETGTNYVLKYMAYPSQDRGIGTMRIPYVGDTDEYYIAAGAMDEFILDKQQLDEFLTSEVMPVTTPIGLDWSNEFDLGTTY